MDNLTHSLIGATLGELTFAAMARRKKSSPPKVASATAPTGALTTKAAPTSLLATPTLRYLLIWIGVIASNFPDLDTLYTGIMPSPLGALLHHRGHTHTLLGCLVGLGLCLLLVTAWPAFRRLMVSDTRVLQLTAAVALLGLALHITADALNSYGVHPFYPLSTRWFYGDLIFIVEPFWWVFLGVPLLLRARPRWLWLSLLGVIIAVPTYASYTGYLSLVSLVALAIALAAMSLCVRKMGSLRALQIGTLLVFVYIGVQAISASHVRSGLSRKYAQPNVRLIDVVLTPMPSNPQCWSAFVLMVDKPTQIFAVVNETVAAFPSLGDAASCPQARPVEFEGRVAVKDLQALMQTDCWFAAWMQFARVPMTTGDGQAVDLRFSRLGRRNFSALPLVHPSACPRFIPGWSLPRADLLQ